MCYIFMEKCQAQNLRSLIKAKGKFLFYEGFLSETEALEIFEGIVNGYLYLTKQKVLHRDLKPSNILFRSNGQPALADFGFCDFLDSPNRPTYYSVGSANYMAP
jgi:serine/threonine protein kinase